MYYNINKIELDEYQNSYNLNYLYYIFLLNIGLFTHVNKNIIYLTKIFQLFQKKVVRNYQT